MVNNMAVYPDSKTLAHLKLNTLNQLPSENDQKVFDVKFSPKDLENKNHRTKKRKFEN